MNLFKSLHKIKLNKYDETNYDDTYISTNVDSRIQTMDYLAGPSTIYSYEGNNQKIILFGDVHVGTNELICDNNSNNIVYVTDYLQYLFENNKDKIYDVYAEIGYIKTKLPGAVGFGMIPMYNNKFKECIENIMDLSKCKYKYNVRFHNVDVRNNHKMMMDIFFNSKYFDTIFLFYFQYLGFIDTVMYELFNIQKILNEIYIDNYNVKEQLNSLLNDILNITIYKKNNIIKAPNISPKYLEDILNFIKLLKTLNNTKLENSINKLEKLFKPIDFNIRDVGIIDINDMKKVYKKMLLMHPKFEKNFINIDKEIRMLLDKYINNRIDNIFSKDSKIISFLYKVNNKKIVYIKENIKEDEIYYFDILNIYSNDIFNYSFFTQSFLFDIYLLCRMLKKFNINKGIIKSEYAKNIFLIAGDAHCKQVQDFLKNYMNYKETSYHQSFFIKQKTQYPEEIPPDIIKYKCIKLDTSIRNILLEF